MSKHCPKCDKDKNEGEFHKNKSMKDGLNCWCKLCTSDCIKQKRLSDPEAAREKDKQKREANSDKVKRAYNKWYEKNKEEKKELDYSILEGQGKTCSRCNVWKEYKNFMKRAALKDGHHSWCKDCFNERQNQWRAEHPEIVKKQNHKFNTSEKSKARFKRYYQNYYINNKEYIKIRTKQWQENNKNRYKIISNLVRARRRARKKNAGGSFTIQQWEELCKAREYRCYCCNEQKPPTVDHIKPIKLGGTSDIDNIQPLCKNCNSSKQTKIIDYRNAYKQGELQ